MIDFVGLFLDINCLVTPNRSKTQWYRVFGDNYHEEGGAMSIILGSNIYTFLIPFKTGIKWITINRNAASTTKNDWYVVTRGWTNTQVDLYSSTETGFNICKGGF